MSRRSLLVAVPLALTLGVVSLAVTVPASAAPAASRNSAKHAGPDPRAVSAATSAYRSATHGAAVAGPQAVAPRAVTPAVGAVSGPAMVYVDLSPTAGGGTPAKPARAIVSRNLVTRATTLLVGWSTTECLDEPRLSPDGNKLVYLDAPNDIDCDGHLDSNGATPVFSKIVVRDLVAATTTILVIPGTNHYVDLPNWDATSSTILYTQVATSGTAFDHSDLFTVAATGGSPAPLTGGADAYDGVYSPDGSKIAYAPTVPSTATYLAVMDSDGNNKVNLTATGHGSFSSDLPSWSPDGKQIAYRYDKPVENKAYTSGLGIVTIAPTVSDRTMPVAAQHLWTSYVTTWSPDGTDILFDNRTVDPATGFASTNTRISSTSAGGTRLANVLSSVSDVVYSPQYVGPSTSLPGGSTFTPITPTRVLAQTPVGAGLYQDVVVSGGSSPVPAGATAVTLNLAGVSPTKPTFLQVYPTPASGTAFPTASNLNLAPGDISAVAVQATVGTGGKVRIRNNAGTTGVVVDVSGYFMPGTGDAGYQPLAAPARAFDGTLGAGVQHAVDVSHLTGAPANPVAVVVNLTAASPTKTTWLAALKSPLPGGVSFPSVSTLNLKAHAIRGNLATVPVDADGTITVYNRFGSTRAVVDVEGYYTAGAGLVYHPLTPTRVLDTRYGTNTWMGSKLALTQGAVVDLPMVGTTTTDSGVVTVPSSAEAVVVNMTAVTPTSQTVITVYPTVSDSTRPLAASINPAAQSITPNLTITKLGVGNAIRIYNNNGNVHLVADIAGYYA